jgi:hypothetical protein
MATVQIHLANDTLGQFNGQESINLIGLFHSRVAKTRLFSVFCGEIVRFQCPKSAGERVLRYFALRRTTLME